MFTHRTGNCHAKCEGQRVLSIGYRPFLEFFQQKTTWVAMGSDEAHRDSCPSTCVDLQVRRFVYISCHESCRQNSISFQDFSCYVVNRSSYRATYIGQQVPWSAHIYSHALGLQNSSGNRMAILGIDVQLKRKKKLLIFGVPTYMVHNQSMVNNGGE